MSSCAQCAITNVWKMNFLSTDKLGKINSDVMVPKEMNKLEDKPWSNRED